MKPSKILGKAGDDNFRVEDCPVHLPKENMKFFQYMRKEANTEPFTNYKQYGNAYHDDWQEKPSVPDKNFAIRVMEAVRTGLSKALNEDFEFGSSMDDVHANKGEMIRLFINKYTNEHPDEYAKRLDIDEKTFIDIADDENFINYKRYLVMINLNIRPNANISISKRFVEMPDIDGIIFMHIRPNGLKTALKLDMETVHKLYYQEFHSVQQFVKHYYVYNPMKDKEVATLNDPKNAKSSTYAILDYELVKKVALHRGLYYEF